jgi:HTH-type transcriptional regulator / antitoxin HigA
MDLRTLRTDQDYKKALQQVELLWDSKPDTPDFEKLNILTLLVEDYEKRNHPIEHPDPIEFIKQIMEDRGLTRKDMETIIGPRGRVSDILTKKRPLTLDMIRRLSDQLQIPVEVLVRPYHVRSADNKSAA